MTKCVDSDHGNALRGKSRRRANAGVFVPASTGRADRSRPPTRRRRARGQIEVECDIHRAGGAQPAGAGRNRWDVASGACGEVKRLERAEGDGGDSTWDVTHVGDGIRERLGRQRTSGGHVRLVRQRRDRRDVKDRASAGRTHIEVQRGAGARPMASRRRSTACEKLCVVKTLSAATSTSRGSARRTRSSASTVRAGSTDLHPARGPRDTGGTLGNADRVPAGIAHPRGHHERIRRVLVQ